MKAFIVKSYGKKGQDVVDKNYAAVDRGGEYKQLLLIQHGLTCQTTKLRLTMHLISLRKSFVRSTHRAGDLLKVSDFVKHETVDGSWMVGTAAYEKRGVEAFTPTWNADNCIQCNKCAYVCPHACIRPFVLNDEELKGVDTKTIDMKAPKAMAGMHFRIQVSVLDCLGCGNCADVCPGNPKTGKALTMTPFNPDDENMKKEAANWEYMVKNVTSKQDLVDIKSNVKNSQFAQPLFEFSGACAGCGETPYVKLISQLFGDREVISNATGCSSIYSASVPATPYCKNAKGQGPAFDNSLFEDFCEFGMGMVLGNKKMKERVTLLLNQIIAGDKASAEYKALAQEWIDNKDDADKTKEIAPKLREFIAEGAAAGCPTCAELKTLDHYLVKRSQWIIGGDGASYDIGYGGLDHVIASGEDVNILVLDTEVYSNTGGQSSKATPLGAIAQFAAQGKRIRKKDLGMIATTYGYVYVAQIAMGADQAQCLKAIREAEAYHGPSLIIAYCSMYQPRSEGQRWYG
jgi:pyruvate-ferredoxin/flavodoxin oxidoreductase